MYQPGVVANRARGQLSGVKGFFLSPFAPGKFLNLVSGDRFGRPVPRESAHSPNPG